MCHACAENGVTPEEQREGAREFLSGLGFEGALLDRLVEAQPRSDEQGPSDDEDAFKAWITDTTPVTVTTTLGATRRLASALQGNITEGLQSLKMAQMFGGLFSDDPTGYADTGIPTEALEVLTLHLEDYETLKAAAASVAIPETVPVAWEQGGYTD